MDDQLAHSSEEQLPSALLERTHLLLANRGTLTLRQVAEGAGVDFEWLSKFARNQINDPGVKKVQAVHDFLAVRIAA